MFIDCLVYVAKERELAFLKQSSRNWGRLVLALRKKPHRWSSSINRPNPGRWGLKPCHTTWRIAFNRRQCICFHHWEMNYSSSTSYAFKEWIFASISRSIGGRPRVLLGIARTSTFLFLLTSLSFLSYACYLSKYFVWIVEEIPSLSCCGWGTLLGIMIISVMFQHTDTYRYDVLILISTKKFVLLT